MRLRSRVMSLRGHHFYAGLINAGSVVIDLGAHTGEFVTAVGSLFECQCYAVEALPSLYAQIPETPLLKKFNCAITESDKFVTLYVAKNTESSSIYELPSEDTDRTVTVRGMMFETLLKSENLTAVDLLKVDIEGAEADLFYSLRDETIRQMKQITIEFHDFVKGRPGRSVVRAIKERLRSLGFFCVVFSLTDNTDALFLNKTHCGISWFERFYLSYVERYFEGGGRFLRRKTARLTRLGADW